MHRESQPLKHLVALDRPHSIASRRIALRSPSPAPRSRDHAPRPSRPSALHLERVRPRPRIPTLPARLDLHRHGAPVVVNPPRQACTGAARSYRSTSGATRAAPRRCAAPSTARRRYQDSRRRPSPQQVALRRRAASRCRYPSLRPLTLRARRATARHRPRTSEDPSTARRPSDEQRRGSSEQPNQKQPTRQPRVDDLALPTPARGRGERKEVEVRRRRAAPPASRSPERPRLGRWSRSDRGRSRSRRDGCVVRLVP